jgi:hypothetical protein
MITIVLLSASLLLPVSHTISHTPAWSGQGTTPRYESVLVDTQTNERSAPLPWGQCMSESSKRLKAGGPYADHAQRWQAATRWRCEIVKPTD